MDFSHRSRPHSPTPPRRHHRPRGLFLCLCISSAIAAGCASSTHPGSANLTTSPTEICEHQWILHGISVDGREQKSRLFWQKMVRDRPYFSCDKLGFVRGSAGSNPYLGKFDLDDDGSIQWIKPPKISRMVGRRDSSALEEDFLKALPRINRASVEGDLLTLQGSDGTRIEFKQAGELPGASR